MNSLSEIILRSYSISQLYDAYRSTGIIDIEREMEHRLSLYDVPTIKFLFSLKLKNNQEKLLDSPYIRNGLKSALRMVPWSIGVVYNYRSAQFDFNNLEIILGKSRAYRMANGQYFKPTWLEANRTGLIYREFVSRNSSIYNGRISKYVSPELDATVRQILVNHNNVGLTVCLYPPQANSFDNPLPRGENKEMWPCSLSVNNVSYPLAGAGQVMQDFNVIVSKTEDYLKLLSLLSDI